MPSLTTLMFWTVRAAVALYLMTLAQLALPGGSPAGRRRDRAARLAWTVGCALLVVHVLLAFHVAHRWDPGDAFRHTADRTAELTGVRSGAGVYLNYLMTAAWAADAAYWWRAGPIAYRGRRVAVAAAVHGFLLFMVVNAAVVFAPPPTRWTTAAGMAAVGVLVLLRRKRRAQPGRGPAAA
jgi:hypothetical protein